MQEQKKETQLVEKLKTLRGKEKYLNEIIKDLSPDELQLISSAGNSFETILNGKNYDKIYLASVFFSVIQPDPSKSILCVNELLVEYPKDYVLYRHRGIDRSDLADYKGAIEDYTKALELKPDDTYAYNNRGNAFYQLKQYQAAVGDYTKALELQPDDVAAYNNRGNVFNELKQYQAAIDDYTKVIDLDPDYADAYGIRGNAFYELKQHQAAIDDYTKAIELQPDFAAAYNNRGNVFSHIKQYQASIDDYTKAIELNPDDAYVYYNRGIAFYELKQYQAAIDDYTKAIELQPDDADTYYNRGIAFRHLGEYPAAIDDYTKAIELNPNYAEAYYNRGLSYKIIGLQNLYFLDFSSYLYLCVHSKDISRLSELVECFEFSYPQNIKTITETFEIDPATIIFNPFESAIDKIQDFTLLLDFYEAKEHFSIRELLGAKALLYYYMGGSVASYIIYDEELDCGDYKLTSQELYYYALSAKDVNLEHETVIANCIREIPKENDTDYYYLAHLYLLQNSKENAIEAFRKSSSFIFSQIMLAFLIDDENEKAEYLAKLKANHTKEFPALVSAINSQAKDLLQFQPYFHYRECSEAIEDIKTNYGIPIYSCDKPFWETFHLEELERDSINKAINEARLKRLFSLIEEIFSKNLEKNTPENKDEVNIELSRGIKDHGRDVKKTFNELNVSLVNDSEYFEKELAGAITDWYLKEPKPYLLFIKYFYLKGSINSEQTFSLFIYLISIFNRKKEKDTEKAFGILFSTIIDLGKTTLPGLALKSILGIAKNVKPFINEFFKDYNAFELEQFNNYPEFKASIWKFIGIEKETLSESQFNQKYKVFEWFDTYKFV